MNLFGRSPPLLSKVMIIGKLTINRNLLGPVLCDLPYRKSIQNICFVHFNGDRNQTKHNFKLNLLAITTFDWNTGFQSDKVHYKA